jgi:hypothetical protein
LYDNENDPYQLNNLVSDPAQQALMGQLDDQILAWLQALRDPFPYHQAMGKVSTFPV